MISNAQKHNLLKEFTEQREAEFNAYIEEKRVRKMEEMKANRPKRSRAGTANPAAGRRTHNPNQIQYTKLYQQLGSKSKNKDVRRSMQARMDAMPANTRVGLQMQLNLNPAFCMDNEGYDTTFNTTFSRPQTAV